jgi:hypothetical protein
MEIGFSGEPPTGKIAVPCSFELVSLWIRSEIETPEQPALRITVVGPDGSSSHGPEQKIDLVGAQRSRSILKMKSLPISGSGYHFLVVETKDQTKEGWTTVARLPLQVKLTKIEKS